MTTPDPNPSADVSGWLDVRHLKAGHHTLIIPVPSHIAELIGRIAMQWGGFELRLDILISTILPRLGMPEPPGWQRMPFKKRKELFKDLMTDYTTKMFPAETDTFRAIADRSGALHWRRNIIAHGYVQARPSPNPASATGYDATFVATGHHKGRYVEIPLDKDTLTALWHEIAHLGGDLMAAVSRMGGRLESASPEIVIADTDFLQGPQSGSFRPIPI